jgi:hypothetical protein
MAKQQTLKWSALGGYIEQIDLPKPKRTIKPYTESPFITDYRLHRDRVLWKMFPESRREIKEMHLNDKLKQIGDSQLNSL